jgi:hypothetical protein
MRPSSAGAERGDSRLTALLIRADLSSPNSRVSRMNSTLYPGLARHRRRRRTDSRTPRQNFKIFARRGIDSPGRVHRRREFKSRANPFGPRPGSVSKEKLPSLTSQARQTDSVVLRILKGEITLPFSQIFESVQCALEFHNFDGRPQCQAHASAGAGLLRPTTGGAVGNNRDECPQ